MLLGSKRGGGSSCKQRQFVLGENVWMGRGYCGWDTALGLNPQGIQSWKCMIREAVGSNQVED